MGLRGPARNRPPCGRRFGRLVVVGMAPSPPRRSYWLCRCDCGTERAIRSDGLKSGETQSCGCIQRERAAENVILANRARALTRVTHGMSHHPVYGVWKEMHQRCGNPNSRSFKNYGGRGIYVDARWNDFERFSVDMGERQS